MKVEVDKIIEGASDVRWPSHEGLFLFGLTTGSLGFSLVTKQHIAVDIAIVAGCFSIDHYAFNSAVRNFFAKWVTVGCSRLVHFIKKLFHHE